jgi:protein SCO1
MRNRGSLFLFLLLSVVVVFPEASCNKSADGPVVQTSPTVKPPSGKRSLLKGKVVSIDRRSKMANIAAEAIPGFMDAMTMPYSIKPEGELDKLSPGDAITADVIIQDDKAWLENIAVTQHSGPSAPR